MSWEAFEPEVVNAIADFLAEVPRSVVMLRLGPTGEILDTNPAFAELFPIGVFEGHPNIERFLEPQGEVLAGSLPTALVTYNLLGSLIPDSIIQGIHVPVRDGSVLVGERLLPTPQEELALLTATTNEMARLHREAQRNYRESKRVQSQLESRHKLLVASTDQGMVHFDCDGRVLDANPGALRILGVDSLSDVERILMEASGEDGLAFVRESHPVLHTLRTGRSRLGVILGLRKGALWILLDAIREFGAEEDKPGGVCATFNDITERTRGEETLLALTQRLQLATAAARLAVWDWDLLTGIMSWDDRMLEIYGVSRKELRGNLDDWKERLHPGDLERAEAECEAAIRGGIPFDTEFRIIRPDGGVVWIKACADVLKDASGKPRRMIGLNQDITAKKKNDEEKLAIQAQLQQAQKMESLGKLAGGIAHDINNVLAAILGTSSVFRDSLPPADPMFHHLETITKACLRGRDVVRGLLIFARQENGNERPFQLNELVNETVQLLSHTTLQRITLRTALEKDLPCISGDTSILSHALINLCVNAVDAMPDGGLLTLTTRRRGDGGLSLIVNDTGTGMPPEVMKKATEPFFTTKPTGQGTGLGLPMVYGAMQSHDGEMVIHSEAGVGTQVELIFPASRIIDDRPGEKALSHSRQDSPGRSILLVDDDELVLASTSAMIQSLGHEVITASGGEEALQMLKAGLQVDMVLLDVNMPGLTGIDTLPQILEIGPEMTVILTSGFFDKASSNLAAAHSNVHLVSKPFEISEIRKIIAEAPYCRPASGSAPVARARPSLKRVLLVDDDEDILLLTKIMLQGMGIQVETASSGALALETLRTDHPPDLVILDLTMPRMDGVQIMGQVRAMHSDLPILISSGRIDIHDWDCFKQPRVALISKPFTSEEIIEKWELFGSSGNSGEG